MSKWEFDNNEKMFINVKMVQVARTFTGIVSFPDEHEENRQLVEMYFGGGYSLTTICTDELEFELKKERN